jgi:hypothetical protein
VYGSVVGEIDGASVGCAVGAVVTVPFFARHEVCCISFIVQ